MRNVRVCICLAGLLTILLISLPWGRRGPGIFLNTSDYANFQDGDIVLIANDTWRSVVVRFLSRDDTRYSHVGVISVDKDAVFLIHAIPDEVPLVGGDSVLREPLEYFLKREDVQEMVLLRLDDSLLAEAAIEIASDFAEERRPFDHKFDLENDNYLYCTELVLVSFKAAGIDIMPYRRDTRYIFPSDLLFNTRLAAVGHWKNDA